MNSHLNRSFQWLESQITQIAAGNKKVFFHKMKKLFFMIFICILIILFFPFFLFVRMFSKFYLIRFGILPSRRIGHFANDVNIYLRLKKKNIFELDLFCLEKPVCNYALSNIYKKYLNIYPEFLILPFIILNKIIYLRNQKHEIKINPFIESTDLRDRDKGEKKIDYFSEKQMEVGYNFLRKIGIKQGKKFACLLVRDPAYVKSLFSNSYDMAYQQSGDDSNFRYSNIHNFKLASEFLISKGYYVIRMGKTVSDTFNINDDKFIDYAKSDHKNDFLDIFLASQCNLFLSTGAGLDVIAAIFDKPIVFIGNTQVAWTRSANKKQLTIFKHFKNNITGSYLSINDIFNYNLALSEKDKFFKDKNIELIENSPEEIKDAVEDMLNLIDNNFELDVENKLIHQNFWKLFKKNIDKFNCSHIHANFFKSHIGYNFLKKNNYFIN